MKQFIVLSITLLSLNTFAISDLDRGILFAANAASMGTFIAQMEGEINQLKLNYEKKAAEFKLQLESDYQQNLRASLIVHLNMLKEQKQKLQPILTQMNDRSATFAKVSTLAGDLYQGLLRKEALLSELQKLSEVDPQVKDNWFTLINEVAGSGDQEMSDSEKYEKAFMVSLKLQAQSEGVRQSLQNQIDSLDSKIGSIEERLLELP
ncbi:MAG: hypothetical protein ACKOX6_09925 [Bdellovibrio sp.]